MPSSSVPSLVRSDSRIRDTLGFRWVRPEGPDGLVEVLQPRAEIASMRNSIKERYDRLAKFRQARFVPLRDAYIPPDDAGSLEIVSDYVQGTRLSDLLDGARNDQLTIDTGAALHIVRELLAAVSVLHESRNLPHGAISPERVIVTQAGRVLLGEYIFGLALERLDLAPARLWRDFRIPSSPRAQRVRLDQQADLIQVGVVALALLAGRPLDAADYPVRISRIADSLIVSGGDAAGRQVPAAVRNWLAGMLPLDSRRSFDSSHDALQALEAAFSKQDLVRISAAPLKALVETFQRTAHPAADAPAARRRSVGQPVVDRAPRVAPAVVPEVSAAARTEAPSSIVEARRPEGAALPGKALDVPEHAPVMGKAIDMPPLVTEPPTSDWLVDAAGLAATIVSVPRPNDAPAMAAKHREAARLPEPPAATEEDRPVDHWGVTSLRRGLTADGLVEGAGRPNRAERFDQEITRAVQCDPIAAPAGPAPRPAGRLGARRATSAPSPARTVSREPPPTGERVQPAARIRRREPIIGVVPSADRNAQPAPTTAYPVPRIARPVAAVEPSAPVAAQPAPMVAKAAEQPLATIVGPVSTPAELIAAEPIDIDAEPVATLAELIAAAAKLVETAAEPIAASAETFAAAAPIEIAPQQVAAAEPIAAAQLVEAAAEPIATSAEPFAAAAPIEIVPQQVAAAEPIAAAQLVEAAAEPVATSAEPFAAAVPVEIVSQPAVAAAPIAAARLAEAAAQPIVTPAEPVAAAAPVEIGAQPVVMAAQSIEARPPVETSAPRVVAPVRPIVARRPPIVIAARPAAPLEPSAATPSPATSMQAAWIAAQPLAPVPQSAPTVARPVAAAESSAPIAARPISTSERREPAGGTSADLQDDAPIPEFVPDRERSWQAVAAMVGTAGLALRWVLVEPARAGGRAGLALLGLVLRILGILGAGILNGAAVSGSALIAVPRWAARSAWSAARVVIGSATAGVALCGQALGWIARRIGAAAAGSARLVWRACGSVATATRAGFAGAARMGGALGRSARQALVAVTGAARYVLLLAGRAGRLCAASVLAGAGLVFRALGRAGRLAGSATATGTVRLGRAAGWAGRALGGMALAGAGYALRGLGRASRVAAAGASAGSAHLARLMARSGRYDRCGGSRGRRVPVQVHLARGTWWRARRPCGHGSRLPPPVARTPGGWPGDGEGSRGCDSGRRARRGRDRPRGSGRDRRGRGPGP